MSRASLVEISLGLLEYYLQNNIGRFVIKVSVNGHPIHIQLLEYISMMHM